jgi:hypothetical protein
MVARDKRPEFKRTNRLKFWPGVELFSRKAGKILVGEGSGYGISSRKTIPSLLDRKGMAKSLHA